MSNAVQMGGTVNIANDRCKGCELCIPDCPQRVLSMSREKNIQGYYYPLLAEGCTGCTACHLVCPDFVFEVYRFSLPTSSMETASNA
jgi:2-oxoglutarate ferredoxin oxidoreductase subunit delta